MKTSTIEEITRDQEIRNAIARNILNNLLTKFLDNPSVDAYNDVKDAMKEFAREH